MRHSSTVKTLHRDPVQTPFLKYSSSDVTAQILDPPQQKNHQCYEYALVGNHLRASDSEASLHGGTWSTTGALAPGASQTPLLLCTLPHYYCYTPRHSMDPLRFTTVVATLLQQLRLHQNTPPQVAPPQYFIIPLVLHHKWR